MLVRSLLQLSKGMGFSPDFSSIPSAKIREVLVSTRELIRMTLEDDPETDNPLAATLWDKAHSGD